MAEKDISIKALELYHFLFTVNIIIAILFQQKHVIFVREQERFIKVLKIVLAVEA
jgi:hypothetical protein